MAAALLASAPALAGSFVAPNCEQATSGAAVSLARAESRWTETASSGRRLVREAGALWGPQLDAWLDCGALELQGRLSYLDGTRSYDGQTFAGAPAQTTSSVQHLRARAQASWRVAPSWQVGVRLGREMAWRDIASTPVANGYPERYELPMAAVGAAWQGALGAGRLSVGGWVGRDLGARLRLWLPSFDVTSLDLARLSSAEAEVALSWPLSPSADLSLGMGVRRLRMGQGPARVLTRNGVPGGVAFQPATTLMEIPVAVGVALRF
ncbi:MAG TPA: hypothetical protein VLJ86_18690 [Ramlibacter sp.]|nr:hypothetical protein [Ramlibacter sp.]